MAEEVRSLSGYRSFGGRSPSFESNPSTRDVGQNKPPSQTRNQLGMPTPYNRARPTGSSSSPLLENDRHSEASSIIDRTHKRKMVTPAQPKPRERKTISIQNRQLLSTPPSMIFIVRRLPELPTYVLTMIARCLKDDGEHLLLATLASTPSVRAGIESAYRGRLELDAVSTRTIAICLPIITASLQISTMYISSTVNGTSSLSRTALRGSSHLWPNIPCLLPTESNETSDTTQSDSAPFITSATRQSMCSLLSMVEVLPLRYLGGRHSHDIYKESLA
jgi:hypothetical protein